MSTVHADLGDLFQLVRQGQADNAELNAEFPFVGLDAPGMPLPGPDFVAAAVELGDSLPTTEGKGKAKYLTGYGDNLHYLYRRALYDNYFQLGVKVKGRTEAARFVPGHLHSDDTADFNGGPRKADIMVVGKHPGQEEILHQRNFVGSTSEELFGALQALGVGEADIADWYFTNLVKFPQLDKQSDGLPKAWIADCLPLLHQELRMVRPDYLLCLGSHASKALLGKWASVSNMVGRVEDLIIQTSELDSKDPKVHTIKVMTATHPAAVYRRTELFEPFKDQLSLFLQLSQGVDIGGVEKDVDHRVIYRHNQLKRIVDEIRADPTRWTIAVDCEWHGDYPTEPNSYLRSVQFSSRHGEGMCVVLRHQGGHPAFKPSIDHAIQELNRLLKHDPDAGYYPRVGGHAFRADMPWLLYNGIDVRTEYTMPERIEDARRGGFETTLMYHATNEAASFKLSDVTARLTTCPRYDKKLDKWKEQYCKVKGLKAKELDGYGMCPDWVLYPDPKESPNYSCYDADATRRIAERCEQEGGLLDSDWFDEPSWQAYWTAHRASPGFLEMEMNGIMLDRDRVDELSQLYEFVRKRLLADFREKINWKTFNPESSKQCVAFLFGDNYGFRLGPNGEKIPTRPPEALTMNFLPIKSTGRRSKAWDQIMARGEEDEYTPSADKEVLGILGHVDPLVMQLRDLKFISQCLKYVLRPPTYEGGELVRDDTGHLVFLKGLASYAHADGRIRTHLSQLKETGRAASARPPLQNLSKRREDDYSRILGTQYRYDADVKDGKENPAYGDYDHIFGKPLYQHPIRTILRASPGHVLVEADFCGAELAVIAWLANDPVMIDHVARGTLKESDPNHYDIHSRTAVRAFQLECAPTKTGMKKAGKKGLRVAAKNVNFGIPYGRMAPAIARQCREEGVTISIEDTEKLIDMYFDTYQGTTAFLRECRERVHDPQWICTPFGRKRRFIKSRDRQVIGEMERQGQNFPIQSTVADAMNRAIDAAYYYRLERPDVLYRMLLQIHDAILFEVPIPHLRVFKEEVLNEVMVNRAPIWPTRLDGTRMDVEEPYRFGIDIDVQLNWGEDITEAQAEEFGIPLDLI